MIGHQLIAEDAARITLQSASEDSLERIVISVLLEDLTLGITTIQGVVNAASFIGSFRSGHAESISGLKSINNDSRHLCCLRHLVCPQEHLKQASGYF